MNKIAKIAGIGTVLASSAFVSAAHVNNTKQSAQAEPKEIAVSKPQNDTQITYIWNNGNPIPQKRESNGSELPFAITTAMAAAVVDPNRFRVNQRDKEGNTPLFNALKKLSHKYNDYRREYCYEKDVQHAFDDVIKIIDDEHFDVTKRDSKDSSYIAKALNISCDKERIKIIIDKLVEKCLQNSNYDPNIADKMGETDIYKLIDYRYYEHAKKLMQLDKFDSTKRYGRYDESLLQQLLSEFIYDEQEPICALLVNKNIHNDKYNPNETNKDGKTDAGTLLKSKFFKYAEGIMELKTFDTSKRDQYRNSYIGIVSRNNVIKENKGINNKEFVSYVVDKVLSNPNYDPNITDEDGYKDIDGLLKNGYIEDAIKIMNDSRFNILKNKDSIFMINFDDNNIEREKIEEFINQYVEKFISSINKYSFKQDNEGYTVMHYLARYGYLNAFDNMLRAYPYFDMNMPAKDGQTAAMLYLGSELSNRIINAPISAEK